MTTKIKTALIIGASRGLGHGLVTELGNRGIEVTGTVRNVDHFETLRSDAPGHVTWQLLDINDAKSTHGFIRNLPHSTYDLIFINAGVGGPDHQSVEKATPDEISDLFMTNAVSPVRLAKSLTGHLRQDSGVLAFMTSILGSVTLTSGTMELYSSSKAALNSLSRSYAETVQESGVTVISMHPGWVRTQLGGSDAPLDVETSVAGMLDVLEAQVGKGGHHYLDYSGKTLPW